MVENLRWSATSRYGLKSLKTALWSPSHAMPRAVRWLGSLRSIEQCLQRQGVLHNWRFQHNVAEVLLDPDIAFEQVFHALLIVVDVAAYETQQIIVTAADKMTFHQLVNVAHIGLESYEIFLAVIDQGDFGEDGDALG